MWWVVGCATAALLVAVVATLVMARGYTRRKLDQLWSLIDTHPALVLPQLQGLIRRLERRRKLEPESESVASTLSQAQCGAALCCLSLGRITEAVEFEISGRATGALHPDWIQKLCGAWLTANPVTWPDVAQWDLAEYLGLPESASHVVRRKQALDTVLRLLKLTDATDAQDLEAVIKLGKRVIAAAPGLDEVQYRLGRALHQAKQWDSARGCLQTACDAKPDDGARRLALARVLRDMGEGVASRTAYLEAHRLMPDPQVAFEAGAVCILTSDVPLSRADGMDAVGQKPLLVAVRLLSEVNAHAPDRTDAWLLRGEAEMQLGHHDQARAALERVVELDPANRAAKGMLGRCHLLVGDMDGVRRILDELKETGLESSEYRRLAADFAYQKRDYGRALPEYRRLVVQILPVPELILRLAKCELEAGDPRQARRLLEGRPQLDIEARLILGRSLARTGQWEQALNVLRAASGKKISHEYAYYTANSLAANRHFAQAAKLFNQLASHPVWGAGARRGAGHVALLCNDLDAAERHYRSLKNETVKEFDLGRLALKRDEVPVAEEHFQRCTEIGGDGPVSPAFRVTARQLRFARSYVAARLGDVQSLSDFEGDFEALPYLQEVVAHSEYDAGRFKQALPLFEQAIRRRKTVPTPILSRLATGYLQQQRFREALPHLVAVSQRNPSNEAAVENVAYCRAQLAREHFRKKRWEAAILEFEGARVTFERLNKPFVDTVRGWETECRFRAGVQALTSPGQARPRRAMELFQEATQTSSVEFRSWFGLALAHAALQEHDPAVSAFAKALDARPDHVGVILAHGLSLKQANRPTDARAAFQQALLLIAMPDASPRSRTLEPAVRLALGMSAAEDRDWKTAAQVFEPLLIHPALQEPGSPITLKDIAVTVVAYYGLAGDKQKATELARRHLAGETIGEILTAVVQAEAGDFTGAAVTLEKVVTAQSSTKVHEFLTSCWLRVAAEKVKADNFAEAEAALAQVLLRNPAHAAALQLQEALRFAEQIKTFDLKALDSTIHSCRQFVTETRSAQLVRTFGVLLHRKALSGDGLLPQDAAWNECCEYWQQRILGDVGFWRDFAEEYNAGKGKRERVTEVEMQEWRTLLPQELAGEHAQLAALATRQRNQPAALTHLRMIWRWKADFKFDLDALLKLVGQPIDDSLRKFLFGLAQQSTDPEVKMFLEPIAEAARTAAELAEFQSLLEQVVQHRTRASELADNAQEYLESVQNGDQGAAVLFLLLIRKARDEARMAKDLMERVRSIAPNNDEINKLYRLCLDEFNTLNSVCQQLGN
jgi:tetratricopeptide (TPR) repeat protein